MRHTDLRGFVTKQIERTVTLKSHHDGVKVKKQSHLEYIGTMPEHLETDLRSMMEEKLFQMTREIAHGMR